MAPFVESQHGTGQQVGSLDGQMTASPDHTGATIDHLGEGTRLMRHGLHLNLHRCRHLTPRLGTGR